jgi:hypothetical protein
MKIKELIIAEIGFGGSRIGGILLIGAAIKRR